MLIQFKVDYYNSVYRLHFPFVLWTFSNNITPIAVTELTAINSDPVGIFKFVKRTYPGLGHKKNDISD
jgi:hypothetical protein